MREKRIYRSCSDRYIAGICGGLAEYFDLDPLLVRLVFVILGFSGVSIVFYILAWLLFPNNPSCPTKISGVSEIRQQAQEFKEEFKKGFDGGFGHFGKNPSNKTMLGRIIILVGAICLIQIIFQISIWALCWPIILIIFGIILLKSNGDKK